LPGASDTCLRRLRAGLFAVSGGSGLRAGSVAVLVIALAGGGCSATRFQRDPCTAHSQCRASFGFGAVCQTDGYCGTAPVARCDRSYPEDLLTDGGSYRDALVLGSLTDRSSPAQLIREKAIRLAVKEANAAGGLDGHPVAVLLCDIQQQAPQPATTDTRDPALTRTQAAVQTARWLAETLGVPGLIGPAASADAQEVWEAVRGAGTLVISPSATSPALARLAPEASDARPGLLWSAAPTDLLQARVIADDLLARNVTHAHILRETGVYGEALANLVADRFRAGGGTLQIESLPSDDRIGAAVATVPDDRPGDVLFISSQQSWIVRFLQAASLQAGFAERTIFLTDAAANRAVFEGAAGASALFPRIRGTRPAPLDPSESTYASFLAGYRAEYSGEDPAAATYAAHAYDAAWLALYGAAWAALQERQVTGMAMARGLRRIGSGEPTPMLPSSWKGALAAFRAGRAIDVRGASGDLDYDPATRAPSGPIEIWGVASSEGMFSTRGIEIRRSP
jgi:branched-chain amino acid transport system substrate-binding protein